MVKLPQSFTDVKVKLEIRAGEVRRIRFVVSVEILVGVFHKGTQPLRHNLCYQTSACHIDPRCRIDTSSTIL